MESLRDMEIANRIMSDVKTDTGINQPVNPLDAQFAALGLESMIPLPKDCTEFTNLQSYLLSSKGQTHGLDFQACLFSSVLSCVVANGGRLKKSSELNVKANTLIFYPLIPPAVTVAFSGMDLAPPISPAFFLKAFGLLHLKRLSMGNAYAALVRTFWKANAKPRFYRYMFGKGVYLADISTKSANYCHSYDSNDTGLLLLCEAQLGKPMLELADADYNAGEVAKEKGCLSTWGQGLTRPVRLKHP